MAAILPTRIGVSSGIRPRLDSSTAVTASGRSTSTSSSTWAARGTRPRRAFPSSLGKSLTGQAANPGTAKPRTPNASAVCPSSGDGRRPGSGTDALPPCPPPLF